MRQYGRRGKVRGVDPNDRGYDRQMENAIKRLPPAELDAFMRGENDDESDDRSSA
jgi:hypothetical protein